MGKFFVATGVALVAFVHVAHAGLPAFCKGKTQNTSNSDLFTLDKYKADRVEDISLVYALSCSSEPEALQKHVEIEAARAMWNKRLGMRDEDWADVGARESYDDKFDYTTKDVTQFTPIDQYHAIESNFDDVATGPDPLYTADMFEQRLTETGRLALLKFCFETPSVAQKDGNLPTYAVCWPDMEKFDAAKAMAEISSDSAHGGAWKMKLRVLAYEAADKIKEATERKAKFIKADDTWQKMFAAAAAARDQWAKDVGGNKKLLDFAAQMDGAALLHSRKLLDGCEPTAEALLADAVSTLPAKAFTGMHDNREMVGKSFAEAAGTLFVSSAQIYIAATAFSLCMPDSAGGNWLRVSLMHVPGLRGPRSAANSAIIAQTWKFDDTQATKPAFPIASGHPAKFSGGTAISMGGVVKSVKKTGDVLVVQIEKTSLTQEECVQEHSSGRIAAIRDSGTVEYAMICDKTAMKTHDTTIKDFKIASSPAVEKALKPGVMFSSVGYSTKGDVIAIWPNKTAKLPNWVMGGAVK